MSHLQFYPASIRPSLDTFISFLDSTRWSHSQGVRDSSASLHYSTCALSEAPHSTRGTHFLITLQTSVPESGTSLLQLFSVTLMIMMQTEPQTQHPQLLLSYDTHCAVSAPSKCYFHSLLSDLALLTTSSKPGCFEGWSNPALTTAYSSAKPRGALWITEGLFIHRMLSHWLHAIPTDTTLPLLKLSSAENHQIFSGRFSLTLSSKMCRSKMHNDNSNGSAKEAVSAPNLPHSKGVCKEELSVSLSFPASITVTLDAQRTIKQNPSRH